MASAQRKAPSPPRLGEMYRRESFFRERHLLGSDEHQAFRQGRVLTLLTEDRELALSVRDVLPKSTLGKAITYLRNQWETLIPFTQDATLPLDNNLSERTLRRVAISRKKIALHVLSSW